jgi:hypothetical protein
MMSPCDAVAERLAVGDPLAELSEHADDCPRCQGLLAVERALSARASSAEPMQGFSSRMTVAASQRLVTRHRRRVVGYAALSAAAAALVTFALVREPGKPETRTAASVPTPAEEPPPAAELTHQSPKDPWRATAQDPPIVEAPGDPSQDADVRALLSLSKHYAEPTTADWDHIGKALKPYRRLLRQVAHE